MTSTVATRRFTVDEYYRMAEVGILAPGERVELIEGEIVPMAAIGSRHAGCVNGLTQFFVSGIAGRAVVAIQNPVRLNRRSEPQPDVAVLHPRSDRYAERHPHPEEVFLLVEVAETSAGYDRGTKAPLYARAGIREYWLVDLDAGVVEVHREPSEDGYGAVTRHLPGEALAPLAFPDFGLQVDEILP